MLSNTRKLFLNNINLRNGLHQSSKDILSSVAAPITEIQNEQKRFMGAKRMSKYFKGKIQFGVRLEQALARNKKKYREAKVKKLETQKGKKLQGYSSYRPKNEYEKQFWHLNVFLNQHPAAPVSDKAFVQLLTTANNSDEMAMALHIFKKVIFRGSRVSPKTTKLIIDKFVTLLEDWDTPINMMKNAKVLRLHLDPTDFHDFLTTLVKRGNVDDAFILFQNLVDGHFPFTAKEVDYAKFMTTLLGEGKNEEAIKAFNIQKTGTYAPILIERSIPVYGLALKAAQAVNNTELLQKIASHLNKYKSPAEDRDALLSQVASLTASAGQSAAAQ